VTDDALRHLGWSDQRRDEFAPLAAAGLVAGRVSLEHNQFYRVLTAAGERLAEATGRMKHIAGGRDELPVVGDWVGLRLDPSSDRAQIREILTRRTRFSRKVGSWIRPGLDRLAPRRVQRAHQFQFVFRFHARCNQSTCKDFIGIRMPIFLFRVRQSTKKLIGNNNNL
jgi:hypothetical protein